MDDATVSSLCMALQSDMPSLVLLSVFGDYNTEILSIHELLFISWNCIEDFMKMMCHRMGWRVLKA